MHSFRRLTLRSVTGTAQRASPTHSPDCHREMVSQASRRQSEARATPWVMGKEKFRPEGPLPPSSGHWLYRPFRAWTIRIINPGWR